MSKNYKNYIFVCTSFVLICLRVHPIITNKKVSEVHERFVLYSTCLSYQLTYLKCIQKQLKTKIESKKIAN